MLILSLNLAASAGACISQPDGGTQTDLQTPDTSNPEPNADLPIILAFGDSLTFGSGVDRALSYPSQLQDELERLGYAYQVVNSGVSGDTTSGGVARLNMALALEPEIVILELGGNDGLRGVPVEVARDNLRTMIAAFNDIGSRVILAGMTLPLNYGPDYIRDFESIYVELAEEFDVVRIPFFLEGLIEEYERYMQSDGIHPTGEGYTIVVETVVNTIKPYLLN
jgi:acyl-CoA thioesterase-1